MGKIENPLRIDISREGSEIFIFTSYFTTNWSHPGREVHMTTTSKNPQRFEVCFVDDFTAL